MAKDTVPPSAIDAIKATIEVGGDKEINALSQELNKMTLAQMQELNRELPAIKAAEAKAHPNLPDINLSIEQGHYRTVEDQWASIHVTRTNQAQLNTPVQQDLARYGRSHVPAEDIYSRRMTLSDGVLTGDTHFDPKTNQMNFNWSNDAKTHRSSLEIVQPDGLKIETRTDESGTYRGVTDPAKRTTSEEFPDGSRRYTSNVNGKNLAQTFKPNGDIEQYFVDEKGMKHTQTTTKAGKTSSTEVDYNGLEKLTFVQDDKSTTSYSWNWDHKSIEIDKKATDGRTTHEEFKPDGTFIKGFTQKPGDWWGTDMHSGQEAKADIQALTRQFLIDKYRDPYMDPYDRRPNPLPVDPSLKRW